MLRRSGLRCVPQWRWPDTPVPFPRMIGYYPEDHSCDYDLQMYTHPQVMRAWYSRHERYAARAWAEMQQRTESANYGAGLHFSGDGPFERELRRKGIQVDKYRLPSTVAVRRVHEMVVLRRKALERQAAQRMLAQLREKQQQQQQQQQAAASGDDGTQQQQQHPSWVDETDGPVNPHFLRLTAGKNWYFDREVDLPRRPIVRRSSGSRTATQQQ